MVVQFIRTTHENGRFRHFPPEANRSWRRYGAVVGGLLRLECPIPFADLMAACRDYALEHAENGPLPELHESYVAWVLIRLIEYGMVTAVPVSPTPTAMSNQKLVAYTAHFAD